MSMSKMPPKTPQPTEWYNLQRYLPIAQEMINYLGKEALDNDDMYYDAVRDEMIYYKKVTDLDRALFQWLVGVEEVWIHQRANVGQGGES